MRRQILGLTVQNKGAMNVVYGTTQMFLFITTFNAAIVAAQDTQNKIKKMT